MSIFVPISKKGNAKEYSNHHTVELLSYASNVMLKILQARLQQYYASLTMLKLLTVWITINCRKFFKRLEYQATLPASWEICMQVKKQQLEADMEQWTGCKLGKEYIKAVYCYPAYLTYMQCTSWETLGWRMHKLESRLPGEISITSDKHMTPPLWQKVKKN